MKLETLHVLRVYNYCSIASKYEKVDEEVLRT